MELNASTLATGWTNKTCKAAFRTATKNVIKSVNKLIAPKSASPNLLMKLPVELRMKVWRFYLSSQLLPEIREVLWGNNAILIRVTYKLSSLSVYIYALEPLYLWLPLPTVLPLIEHVVIGLTPPYNKGTDFFSNETMDTINTWNIVGCRCLNTLKLIVPGDAMKKVGPQHLGIGV